MDEGGSASVVGVCPFFRPSGGAVFDCVILYCFAWWLPPLFLDRRIAFVL